jgi:hypothetical protein
LLQTGQRQNKGALILGQSNKKTRSLEFFMTIDDEREFCKKIREFYPNIVFMDTKPSMSFDVDSRLFECVTETSRSEFFTFDIVNLDFTNKEELGKSYTKHSEYYHFYPPSKASMQFLRSGPERTEPQNLQHGRIADSYDSEDEEEKKWKNKIYSILRKMGQGNELLWYYHTPEGLPEISEKAYKKPIALADAYNTYTGKNGRFLLQSKAKFVGKGVAIEELIF